MRFDDRLATILAFAHGDARARAILWRQIIDVLAQAPAGRTEPLPIGLPARLRELQGQVPVSVRVAAVAACLGRRVHPAVVAIAVDDVPAVARAALGGVMLDEAEWLSLLPRLSVTAKAILWRREDLPNGVRVALARLGSGDFALPAPPTDEAKAGQTTEPVPARMMDSIIVDHQSPDITPDDEPDQAADSTRAVIEAEPVVMFEDEPEAIEWRDSSGPLPAEAATFDETSGEPADGQTISIPDLLARIAAYQRETPAPPPPIETFRFETDAGGTIDRVEGAPRIALAGLSIARARHSASDGVESRVADAFRRRASFRDAMLTLSAGAMGAAPWLISGVPAFDAANGRFIGYRGIGNRQPDVEAPYAMGLFETGLTNDGLRQLVHELRTPLNAIIGFGEMVEGQVLGPAAARYRAQAGAIVEQGRHLLDMIDDLDLATRPDLSGTSHLPVSPAIFLSQMWDGQQAAAAARGVSMRLQISAEAERTLVEVGDMERLFTRLTTAVIGLCQMGETLAADLSLAGAFLILSLTRPVALQGRTEAEIFATGFVSDAHEGDAPPLGLGFTLRLVRKLAMAAGGGLEIQPHHLVLRLPAASAHGSMEVSR